MRRSADRREILHDDQYYRPNFIMAIQNFAGALSQKILGAKNMQNLARFRTTLKFGDEYLRNR